MTFPSCIRCYNRHMQTKFDLVLEISENYFAEFDFDEGDYFLVSTMERYPENEDGTGEMIEYRSKASFYEQEKAYKVLDEYLSND